MDSMACAAAAAEHGGNERKQLSLTATHQVQASWKNTKEWKNPLSYQGLLEGKVSILWESSYLCAD